MFFDKVVIAGVGLIGASFALALREKKLCGAIYGFGRREENLRTARQRGIVDGYGLNIKDVCEDADLILFATPVGRFKELALSAAPALKKGALVTDVGSVKGGLVHELEALMPDGAAYVGSHPIAGSDKSGIDNARSDLFQGARCIVTPTGNSDEDALKKVSAVWEALGAKVEFMDPVRHDEIYAAVSHLPHLVAFALVNSVDDFNRDFIQYAGVGFKDATRIALSSPELWRDISFSNKDNLLKLMQILRANVMNMEEMLAGNDTEGLEREFSRARESRKKLE